MKRDDLFVLIEQLFDISEKLGKIDRTPHYFGVDEPITRAEIHLVADIAREEGRSVTELARSKGVTKGAISQMLSRLEKKGLIEKKADAGNNSRLLILLTPKGCLANAGHDRVHERIHHLFVEHIGELDDRTHVFLKDLFTRIERMLDGLEEKRF